MSDWGEVVGQADGLPQLPVSLSVKLIRPNEDSTTFLGSMQEDTIGREGLVLVDFDYVADTNILSSLQIPVSVGVKVPDQRMEMLGIIQLRFLIVLTRISYC